MLLGTFQAGYGGKEHLVCFRYKSSGYLQGLILKRPGFLQLRTIHYPIAIYVVIVGTATPAYAYREKQLRKLKSYNYEDNDEGSRAPEPETRNANLCLSHHS